MDNSTIEINPDLSNEGYVEYDDLVKAIHEGINEEDIKYINEYNITSSSLNNDNNKSLANNNIIFISDLIKQLRNKFNNKIRGFK